ncbi:MAG TPA: hypothetical protein PKY81_00585 [bacterium]|nr:hypothetical protein [bacterium]HPN29429.1 hypothetical protein [bacterium]
MISKIKLVTAVLTIFFIGFNYSGIISVQAQTGSEKKIISEPVYYFINRPVADKEIISVLENPFHRLIEGYTEKKTRDVKLYEFEFLNNKIISVNIFQNENKIRKFVKWNFDGEKTLEENYKRGDFHGKRTEWYDNGNIKLEENYLDGNLHGKCVYRFPNNTVSCEANYDNGLLNGKRIKYYENGMPQSEETFLKNRKTGYVKLWDSRGFPILISK